MMSCQQQNSEVVMSKEGNLALEREMDKLRAEDPRLDEKMAYWNLLEQKHNTTGLSLMQLNDTKEGQKKATQVCHLIGRDMIAKFGA
jgi:hypothetical protein|tara:strand:+ start:206 stop:466 length:261 start_codon:yes stop_codon:yes gene_type:complete